MEPTRLTPPRDFQVNADPELPQQESWLSRCDKITHCSEDLKFYGRSACQSGMSAVVCTSGVCLVDWALFPPSYCNSTLCKIFGVVCAFHWCSAWALPYCCSNRSQKREIQEKLEASTIPDWATEFARGSAGNFMRIYHGHAANERVRAQQDSANLDARQYQRELHRQRML